MFHVCVSTNSFFFHHYWWCQWVPHSQECFICGMCLGIKLHCLECFICRICFGIMWWYQVTLPYGAITLGLLCIKMKKVQSNLDSLRFLFCILVCPLLVCLVFVLHWFPLSSISPISSVTIIVIHWKRITQYSRSVLWYLCGQLK